jgi:hypothetical protein
MDPTPTVPVRSIVLLWLLLWRSGVGSRESVGNMDTVPYVPYLVPVHYS